MTRVVFFFRRPASTAIVLGVLAAGCVKSTAHDRDAAVGADDASASVSDASTPLDAAPPPAPTALPLTAGAIAQVNTVAGVDVYAAMAGDRLVFEHFDETFTTGSLYEVQIIEGGPSGAPQRLALDGTDAITASPSFVRGPEGLLLYAFTAADSSTPGRVRRWVWTEGSPGVSEPVTLPEPMGLLSWPRFVSLGGGRVAVAYRDGATVVKLAFSDDGVTFGPGVAMGPAGAQPELGRSTEGRLIYAYQVGSGSEMISYFRTTSDGERWSDAAPVTTMSDNVHDTAVFARGDGGVDLYYIYPDSPAGFDLWRRCVRADGSLGPEQLLVERTWGNLAKPRPHRRADGGIQLTFVDQNRGHLLFTTSLFGDAPCN